VNLTANMDTIAKLKSMNVLRNKHRFSSPLVSYEGWNFNSGNYLFTTDIK